jgi:hypothetical protein
MIFARLEHIIIYMPKALYNVSVTADTMFGYTLGRELMDVGVRDRESHEEFECCSLMRLFLNDDDGCSHSVCLNSKFSNMYQVMFGIGAGLHAVACSFMILLDRDKQK